MRSSVALAVAVALAGALAPAAASATPPSLIRLVSTTTSYSHVDVKPKGASAGDRDTFASRLVNQRAQFGKPKGAVVGSDRGTLLYTSDRTATMKAVVKLPGGTVVIGGAIRPVGNNAVVVSVVEGTGVFSGASGTVTILGPTSSKTAVNVYRLTYAPVA